MTEGRCKCGHLKTTEHDYFGCVYATCQVTCKRRYGSTEGKPRSPSGKGRGG